MPPPPHTNYLQLTSLLAIGVLIGIILTVLFYAATDLPVSI